MLRSAVVGLTALVAVSTGSAMAQEKGKLEEVLERGHLIVGTGSTNAPWHFKDESGNLVGFDVDVAKLVAKGLFGDDTKIEFVDQSSDSRIPNVTTGKVDITCQFMTVTAERAQQVNFTVPYYREGVALLVSAGGKLKTYDELKAAGSGATVSVCRTSMREMVHAALPEAKSTNERVDLRVSGSPGGAAATDQSSAKWLIVTTPGKYLDSGYGWNPQSYSCAVKRGDQDWLNFVNTTLHEAMTGVEFGTYSASFKKWFGVELAPPAIGFPVEYQ
jgi:polar amino acid transport system substrate-binding protein